MKADEWLKADESRLAQVTTTVGGRLRIELIAPDKHGSGKSFARAEGDTIGEAAMNLERAWPAR